MKKFCFTMLVAFGLWLSLTANSNAGVHVGVFVGAPGPVFYPEPVYYGGGPYYGGYYPHYYHGRHYYGHYGHYGHQWH
jgi:hypothetical protein